MWCLLKLLFCTLFILPSHLFGKKTTTIKVFHVFESFGQETQELKNSIVMNYLPNGVLNDSTVYSHTIPLDKKYVYVSGSGEGLKLQRTYKREIILSYRFENDKNGKRISTSLYGSGDSLYWKEYQKYDDKGKIIKKIRYNPLKAINPDTALIRKGGNEMLWGESYSYDSTGRVLTCKELYNNYALVVTTFQLDSLGSPIKTKEYFDPSVIFQTIFFHNDFGYLIQESTTGILGNLIESKTHEYDILGRRVATTVYNDNGTTEKIYNTVFDDDNFKIYDYYTDSLIYLSSIREVLLDNNGRTHIEAILDGKNKVLEKNVYNYDNKGRISEIKSYDMVRLRTHRKREIPIRVNIYEYD